VALLVVVVAVACPRAESCAVGGRDLVSM
jgi:hypothetical protein